MALKKPKSKPKQAMPKIAPPPSGKRRTKPRRVSAAVCMPDDLYTEVIEKRLPKFDDNFSRYVRDLVRADLALTA